ncbi:FAD-dependent oxidoreductase [Devosia rhodophyticola]|uniref:FAD-dependent oxidoreductase n=1 Tax=Devosia rhodophyticola TaxID=3026423 RepID=A0ABY7Z1C9_9HYPH|nr:FAD-dependent oxidoreductase [Devosia rhodophyticola]WDR07478.1 FAD-dependent oxidoreductase [Devosia rhodophyticola]
MAGLGDIDYFTTDTIISNFRKLTHLLVIGGGPAGLELAQAFCRLGCTVSLIEKSTVLRFHDRELVDIALRGLREEGVDIREHSTVSQIEARSQGIGVRITNEAGDEQTLDVSHVLVAAGRHANIEGLDLGLARVATTGALQKRVRLNRFGGTSNFRIFAIGDAAGAHAQLPEIEHQATMAIHRALLGRTAEQAPLVARTVYTDPELAEVGMTEAEAKKRIGKGYRLVRCAFSDNRRALAIRQTYGVAKMVCAPNGSIVGASIVGPQASELVALFSMAIAQRLNARHFEKLTPVNPTLSEILQQLGTQYGRDRPLARWIRPIMAIKRALP